MEKTKFIAQHISKLTLGTVQLGMDYGIANRNGKPQKEDSWQLLKYALSTGTRALDTARHYQSEEIIGESGLAPEFTIVSKFKLNQSHLQSFDLAMEEARKSVSKSCEALKIKKLPICLFHQDIDHPIAQVMELLPQILKCLKKEGLIEIGGISVYYPQELNYIKDWSTIAAVQVAMNVFDLRLLKNGLLQRLKQNGTAVFIRSVFLQGMLLMKPEDLPQHLKGAEPYLVQLNELASAAGLSVAQLVFSYIRDTEGVTSLVIGAENVEQIRQNVDLLHGPGLSTTTRLAIEEKFRDLPEAIITPGLWPAHHQIK